MRIEVVDGVGSAEVEDEVRREVEVAFLVGEVRPREAASPGEVLDSAEEVIREGEVGSEVGASEPRSEGERMYKIFVAFEGIKQWRRGRSWQIFGVCKNGIRPL